MLKYYRTFNLEQEKLFAFLRGENLIVASSLKRRNVVVSNLPLFNEWMVARVRTQLTRALLTEMQPGFKALINRIDSQLTKALQEYDVQSRPRGTLPSLRRVLTRKRDPRCEVGSKWLEFDGQVVRGYQRGIGVAQITIWPDVIERRARLSLIAHDPALLERILRQLAPEIKLHTTGSERILYILLQPVT